MTKHRFLAILMLLTLMGCSSDNTLSTMRPIDETERIVTTQTLKLENASNEIASRFLEESTEERQMPLVPNLVKFINDNLRSLVEWSAKAKIQNVLSLMTNTILGMHPEWRNDYCDHPFALESSRVVCERNRDKGHKWAEQISKYIYEEATRQSLADVEHPLNYLWFVGQGQRESGLSQGDVCKITLAASWVEEVPANAQLNERVRMCWRRGAHAGRNCQKVYLRARNERQYVVDRCAFGEVGIFQVRSHEAKKGQIIPATSEPLPGPWDQRREMLLDPQKNISLAFAAFASVRDYCCPLAVDPEVCKIRPDYYLGCYNTGKCRGTGFIHYVDKIGRALVKAMKYVCSVSPNLIFGELKCNKEDMQSFFTPPGRPRRSHH